MQAKEMLIFTHKKVAKTWDFDIITPHTQTMAQKMFSFIALLILDFFSPDEDDCNITAMPKKAAKIVAKIEAVL